MTYVGGNTMCSVVVCELVRLRVACMDYGRDVPAGPDMTARLTSAEWDQPCIRRS